VDWTSKAFGVILPAATLHHLLPSARTAVLNHVLKCSGRGRVSTFKRAVLNVNARCWRPV